MLPILQSIENGSKYMGESIVAALGTNNNGGNIITPPKKTKLRVLFTRDGHETMSETYEDGSVTMGEIFDHAWANDSSQVFLLTKEQEVGMIANTYEYRMFVSSVNKTAENPYTQQTFATENLSSMSHLVDSNLVRVKISCTKKTASNIARRKLFSWRS